MSDKLDRALKDAADYLGRMEKTAQNPLEDIFRSIPDNAKTALKNALIGGLIGGGAGAYMGEPGGRLGAALTGAGLGAFTGGAGTLGTQMLAGDLKLPSERRTGRGVLGGLTDAAVGSAVANPALTLMGIGGGATAYVKGPRVARIKAELERILDTTKPGTARFRAAKGVLKDLPGIEADTGQLRDVFNRTVRAGNPADVIPGTGAPLSRAGITAALKSDWATPAAQQMPWQRKIKPKVTAIKNLLSNILGAGQENVAHASRSLKVNRLLNRIGQEPLLSRPSRASWALLPLGILGGLATDKYIKGDY